MTDHYQLTVAGGLSDAVTETIVSRFGDGIRIRPIGGRTMLNVADLDQPALRAMLVLLWDFGHEVLSVSSEIQHSSTGPSEPLPDTEGCQFR